MKIAHIDFPEFTGIRCLMMPYIQGEIDSVPAQYHAYSDVISNVFAKKGDVGYLTIDESIARQGTPHRGKRAKFARALHTEAGRFPNQKLFKWGTWRGRNNVTLDRNVQVILANNLDGSCAVWDAVHEDTSLDGDIGYAADMYPYSAAIFMKAGDVHQIGILTPHESIPVKEDFKRQFIRIISSGIYGREPYFTANPLFPV